MCSRQTSGGNAQYQMSTDISSLVAQLRILDSRD